MINISVSVSGPQIARELADDVEEFCSMLIELAERCDESFFDDVHEYISKDSCVLVKKFLACLADVKG